MKAEVAYEYQYAQKIIFHVSSYYCYILYYITKGQRLGDAEKSTLMN